MQQSITPTMMRVQGSNRKIFLTSSRGLKVSRATFRIFSVTCLETEDQGAEIDIKKEAINTITLLFQLMLFSISRKASREQSK